MKKIIVLIALATISSTAFATANLSQDVANAVREDSDTIGLIKALENSKRWSCNGPGDEETAVNSKAKTFSADFGCMESDDGTGAVVSTVTMSGKYSLSRGKIVVRINSLRIND